MSKTQTLLGPAPHPARERRPAVPPTQVDGVQVPVHAPQVGPTLSGRKRSGPGDGRVVPEGLLPILRHAPRPDVLSAVAPVSVRACRVVVAGRASHVAGDADDQRRVPPRHDVSPQTPRFDGPTGVLAAEARPPLAGDGPGDSV